MAIRNLKVTLTVLLNSHKFMLVEQHEKVRYENGKATDKTYICATITTPESGFERVDVKLDGEGLKISNDELLARNNALTPVWVQFDGDECKLYQMNGETRVSAKAKSIRLADEAGDISEDSEISL